MPEEHNVHVTPPEEEDLFGKVHAAAMAGIQVVAAAQSAQPMLTSPLAHAFESLCRAVRLLEQRVAALEAERGQYNQGHLKCPRCHRLSLNVIATGPHPEFGDLGIEQQQVSCDCCSHTGHRLHDPAGYLR